MAVSCVSFSAVLPFRIQSKNNALYFQLFLSEEQLESHLSMHYLSASSEFGCSSCNKTFNKPDELQKHLMDIHAHHLYRCSLCKDVFDSKVNIQVSCFQFLKTYFDFRIECLKKRIFYLILLYSLSQ
jgi:DNA-directed RNA polymerase subunit RPC12/RpoP